MIVQSVLIPKKMSLDEAHKWLKKNNYKLKFYGKSVDITNGYYRFRQHRPLNDYEKKKGSFYVTYKLSNGIKLILMSMK